MGQICGIAPFAFTHDDIIHLFFRESQLNAPFLSVRGEGSIYVVNDRQKISDLLITVCFCESSCPGTDVVTEIRMILQIIIPELVLSHGAVHDSLHCRCLFDLFCCFAEHRLHIFGIKIHNLFSNAVFPIITRLCRQ